jgi:hypothetical protein
VKQSDQMEEDYFQDALQNGGTFSKDYARLYGRPDAVTGEIRDASYRRQLARFVSGSHAQVNSGGDLVRDLLQDYTDEWLETGIDSQGQEQPFTRKLTLAGSAWSAVMGYEHAQHPVVIDWNNGLERRRKSFAERLRVDPLEQVPTSKVSLRSKERLAAANNSTKDFENRLFSGLRRYRTAKMSKLPHSYTNMPRDVVKAARLRSACLFHALMEAPWRYKLGRCKRCYSYFVLKNKPASIYVRGMHCPNCKNIASAGASAKTRRAEREAQILGFAVEVWSSWRRYLPPGKDRNKWIAEEVSRLLGETKGIQRNWVTHHEKEIVAKLKARTPVARVD